MAKTWVYQDPKQLQQHGAKKASWYVGWFDPEGKKRSKSCGPGSEGKKLADKEAERIKAQLITGTYQDNTRKTWAEFRREYEQKIASGMSASNRRLTLESLGHFERLVKPVRVSTIRTQTIDDFRALRRKEPGKKRGTTLSPASVNKDLRHLRAVLRKAAKWGYCTKAINFEFEREPHKLVTYVTAEHFAAIYQACEQARQPRNQPYQAADWWRALIVLGYMTGWRISDMLGLQRQDLDLETGLAVTRFEDNKGKRDERVRLHPVVVEHLRKLASFDVRVFPWPKSERTLYDEFARIQRAAGINLPCARKHQHTPACHVYGFHDLRRAFATMNADRLSADALQHLMRHKSYITTQRYIAIARQEDSAVASLHVPDVLAKKA